MNKQIFFEKNKKSPYFFNRSRIYRLFRENEENNIRRWIFFHLHLCAVNHTNYREPPTKTLEGKSRTNQFYPRACDQQHLTHFSYVQSSAFRHNRVIWPRSNFCRLKSHETRLCGVHCARITGNERVRGRSKWQPATM